MKFLSGARSRSATYVVFPARPIVDVTTGRSTVTTALRVAFKDHRWDSEHPSSLAMYKEYADALVLKEGRTATAEEVQEVKTLVEKYLLSHNDFGRGDGRGIFLDNTDTLRANARKNLVRRCLFMQDLGEETQQCEQQVVDPESDYCEAHKAIIEATVPTEPEMAGAGEG